MCKVRNEKRGSFCAISDCLDSLLFPHSSLWPQEFLISAPQFSKCDHWLLTCAREFNFNTMLIMHTGLWFKSKNIIAALLKIIIIIKKFCTFFQSSLHLEISASFGFGQLRYWNTHQHIIYNILIKGIHSSNGRLCNGLKVDLKIKKWKLLTNPSDIYHHPPRQ